jgi:hypothetical protein
MTFSSLCEILGLSELTCPKLLLQITFYFFDVFVIQYGYISNQNFVLRPLRLWVNAPFVTICRCFCERDYNGIYVINKTKT